MTAARPTWERRCHRVQRAEGVPIESYQVFTGTHPVYNLVPPSQYTVTGLRANTSTVTFNAAPAPNLDILILRTVPMDQPADITNQGAFLPEIHEDAFDYRVMQLQQLLDSGMQLVQDPDSGEFVWDRAAHIIRVGDAKGDADAVNFRTVLVLIEQIQNGGGSVGIAPKFWSFEGDGEVTDFRWRRRLDALFYDTALEKTAGLETTWYRSPATEFCLVAGCGSGNSLHDGAGRWATGLYHPARLRRPWIGETPIYTVAPHCERYGQHNAAG